MPFEIEGLTIVVGHLVNCVETRNTDSGYMTLGANSVVSSSDRSVFARYMWPIRRDMDVVNRCGLVSVFPVYRSVAISQGSLVIG